MDDILEVIKTRRSIRRYKPDPIPDEILDRVLEAARWAPSGENYQPWRLIVIKNTETKNKIGQLAKVSSGSALTASYSLGVMQRSYETIQDPVKRQEVMRFMYSGEFFEFIKQAPVVIVVIGSLMEGSVDVPYDLSACVENMLLEAHSLGLGACWVRAPISRIRGEAKIKKVLKIPAGMGEYKVLACVALGWPAEARRHPRPKKPLEEIVFWEEFGRKERS